MLIQKTPGALVLDGPVHIWGGTRRQPAARARPFCRDAPSGGFSNYTGARRQGAPQLGDQITAPHVRPLACVGSEQPERPKELYPLCNGSESGAGKPGSTSRSVRGTSPHLIYRWGRWSLGDPTRAQVWGRSEAPYLTSGESY